MLLPMGEWSSDRFRRLQRRTRARASVFGALVLALACGCSAEPESDGRGVLVIAIDALRYDHLSASGYDRPTTPALDALAREGVFFKSAWSAGPGIIPAHVSLLTGCDPLTARKPPIVLADGSKIPPAYNWSVPRHMPGVALEFLASGWQTAAFVDHPWVGGLRGFEKGFTEYQEYAEPTQGVSSFGVGGVGSRFVSWVTDLDRGQNWFAYLHMNDLDRLWEWNAEVIEPLFEPRPELSAVPPVGLANPIFHAVPHSRALDRPRSIGEYEAIYDTALHGLDFDLKRLLGFLRKSGRLDRTTVVVVGTFGVGFGESGLILSSGTLSDVDLHVPLIIRPEPGLPLAQDLRAEQLVSLIDVAPTLLELAGIVVPSGMQGVSLTRILAGGGEEVRELAFASSAIHRGFAVIDGRYCFEQSSPGSRGPGALSSSWFGDSAVHREEVHEVLHDRVMHPFPGHLDRKVGDRRRAATMRAAGANWYRLVYRVRELVHLEPWRFDQRDPKEIASLRRHGMLGELPD